MPYQWAMETWMQVPLFFNYICIVVVPPVINFLKLFKSDMYVGSSPSQSWKQTWLLVWIPHCFTQNWKILNSQRKESPVALQYLLKMTSLIRAKDGYRQHLSVKRNNTLILINSQSRKLQEITGDWQQKERLPPQIINPLFPRETFIRCYVKPMHSAIAHRGRDKTERYIRQSYAGISQDIINLFVSL